MDFENNYIEAHIENVSLSNMGFVIFLREADSERVLPIFIGASEAHSISTVLNHQKVPRPLTHDLFKNVLEQFGGTLLKIHITSVAGETFFATVTISFNGKSIEIDSRPSDAIGLALRFGAPVYVNQKVLESAGIVMTEENKEEHKTLTGKGQLETYRNALQKAIGEERYEDAARLRDQIFQLQKHQ